MCVVVNNTELNSLGISVSKKVGNSVTRNRITRLIREAYRLNENIFLKGYDIIFCAQSVSRYSDFSSICYSICTLANQLSLCKVKK
jgi:ribonuclease P protein component